MRPTNVLLTSCLMFTVIAGAPALAAYAIAFNPSNGRAAAYNGSFDLRRPSASRSTNAAAAAASSRPARDRARRSSNRSRPAPVILGRGEGFDQGNRRQIGLVRMPPQGRRQLQHGGRDLRLTLSKESFHD